jgi:5,10-methylenetetrahydrofolate reductase
MGQNFTRKTSNSINKMSKLVPVEIADCYQKLFNHMSQEHGLILTIQEMDEIIHLSQQTKEEYNQLMTNSNAQQNEIICKK